MDQTAPPPKGVAPLTIWAVSDGRVCEFTRVLDWGGARVTSAYLIPRTRDDLRFRREGIKFVARQTFGTVGRGIDMIATLPIGMLSENPSFKRECPEYADNIHWYIKHLEENIAAAGLELPLAAYDKLSAVSHPPASLRG